MSAVVVSKLYNVSVSTRKRNQLIDVTDIIRQKIRDSKVRRGICVIYVPHTTAGVTVNENADPSVASDIEDTLVKLIPPNAGYKHLEGNADSHIKSVLVGPSITLPVEAGDLVLGTWQGVFFCEFDGPRSRRMYIRVIGET